MRGAFVYVSLKINQEEIAEKYCENKNITMCYGSCYISSKVKAAESENENLPSKSQIVKSNNIDSIQHQVFEVIIPEFYYSEEIHSLKYLNSLIPQNYLCKVLKPPQRITV